MKERGRYQMQCMKSRSSTGVGQKIDLEYNLETMRITDPGEDANIQQPHASSIMNQIKARASVEPAADEVPAPHAELGSNKLKSMLAGIKAQSR